MRILGKKSLAVLAGLAVLLSLALWYFMAIYPMQKYTQELRMTFTVIDELYHARPPGVPELIWEECVSTVQNGVANSFFSPEYSSYQQLQSFRADLIAQRRRGSRVDSTTLVAIWSRIEKVDSRGGRLAVNRRPLFDDCILHLKNYEEAVSED